MTPTFHTPPAFIDPDAAVVAVCLALIVWAAAWILS